MPRGKRKKGGNVANGVPVEFLDDIEAVSYATGVPRSWLAAVCEMTGWNPDLEEMNYDRVPNSIRRFGIAGIWASINEIPLNVDPSQMICQYWSVVPAGWMPAIYWAGTQLWQGSFCVCPGATWGGTVWRKSVRDNLNCAAGILKKCGETIERICGGYNELIFLRWQLGCNYLPQKDDQGNCIIPPGLPSVFKREMDNLVVAQKIYAEIFGEPGIGVPPPVITLTANTFITSPGQVVTFMAAIAGGNPPYALEWDFGDGGIFNPDPSPIINPSVGHAYESIGTYTVKVTVTDRVGQSSVSPPIGITIEEGAPPPPSGGAGGLALLGLLGLAGVIGLAAAKKKKKAGAK